MFGFLNCILALTTFLDVNGSLQILKKIQYRESFRKVLFCNAIFTSGLGLYSRDYKRKPITKRTILSSTIYLVYDATLRQTIK